MSRPYALLAVALTVAGELEVLLGSAAGGSLVSALAVPALALPLAWSRRAPVAVLAVVALALLAQAALGGFLIGHAVMTIIALGVALYAAGRHAIGAWRLAGAGGAATVLAVTRIAFDPAAQHPREAALTFLAVAVPLVVGRWARGQTMLQRELVDKATRRGRDRDRYARQAADEERARIAADLQVAVAGGLRTIIAAARPLHDQLRAGVRDTPGERLAAIAATARAALADVRRVLGVLRHDGDARRLTPPALPAAGADMGAPRSSAPTGVGAASGAVPSGIQRKPRRIDALLAAGVFAVAALELVAVAPRGDRATAVLTAVAIAAPLLWRRRDPLAAAFAVLAAVTLQSALLGLDAFPAGDIAAMVCATYAVGAHAAGRPAVAGGLLIAVGAAAHAAIFYPGGVVPALLGGVVLPWTVGRVVRGHRHLTLESREKHLDVERSRAREAGAAIMSERMRVARELHDAVAHNISVIAIQAAGAEGLVERDPERARQCVELIVAVAREALSELGRLAEGPGDDGGAPAPSLAEVDQLADRARAAGLSVTVRVDRRPSVLPAGVDLAAFRIVQEALANTTKHAQADRAWVTVRYSQRAIELEVGDDGRGPKGAPRPRDGGGHGLIGMRERVALYGGSLDAGPHSAGGYRVRARLPVDAA